MRDKAIMTMSRSRSSSVSISRPLTTGPGPRSRPSSRVVVGSAHGPSKVTCADCSWYGLIRSRNSALIPPGSSGEISRSDSYTMQCTIFVQYNHRQQRCGRGKAEQFSPPPKYFGLSKNLLAV